MRESCVRPMIQSKLQKFWFQSVDVDGVYTETKNRVSEGTAVESEQGWFQLALYNLSNLFLMLTVQILFVSHFRKTLCKKKKRKKQELFVYLLFESEHGNQRQRAVFFTINGSHEVLFVTLQYIKTPFCSILQIQDLKIFKLFFFCTISILYNYTRSSSIMACGLK